MKFKNILFLIGAILAFVGFGFMFVSPLTVGETITSTPIIAGIIEQFGLPNGAIPFDSFYFGVEGNEPLGLICTIGFFMMLLGGLLAIVLAFLSRKKKVYLITLILGVVVSLTIIAGGVMGLCAKPVLIAKIYDGDVEMILNTLNELITTNTMLYVGTCVGMGGGLLTLIASVLPGPKGKRK